MSKRVVIISTSPRHSSNSHALAEAFEKGAREAGNETELISLRGKKIAFCLGCFKCQEKGECVIRDDAVEIEKKVLDADVVVWATPIYYYEMSGQMKTLIDRLNPLFPKDYRFRDVYLLATAADDGESTPDRAVEGVKGWVECFEKAAFRDYVFCGGVNDPGDIVKNEKLDAAYRMGRSI